jgi:hypothetical protein
MSGISLLSILRERERDRDRERERERKKEREIIGYYRILYL